MQFQWKSFKVDLKSFYEWLIINVPNANGIIAFEEYFEIPSKSVFTQEEIDLIQNHYNELNEESELLKINKPKLLEEKILEITSAMVSKSYDELNTIERKILLRIPLTNEELDSLLS